MIPVAVGIDYGGTWIRLFAIDKKRKKIQSLKIVSQPIEKLPFLLHHIFKNKGWNPKELELLVIGARGVWKKDKRKSLQKKLRDLAKTVRVLSDIEMAYQSIFEDKPGIIILAGTGSIAYGQDASGKRARAGGYGPSKGDEGSGYWIGQKSLHLFKSRIRKKSIQEIASLAISVIEKAKKKDPAANKIIEQACQHLADLVVKVLNQLHFKETIPLSWSGGLFKSSFFRKKFLKTLKKVLWKNCLKIKAPCREPVTLVQKIWENKKES